MLFRSKWTSKERKLAVEEKQKRSWGWIHFFFVYNKGDDGYSYIYIFFVYGRIKKITCESDSQLAIDLILGNVNPFHLHSSLILKIR